jgi:hypothetical protein
LSSWIFAISATAPADGAATFFDICPTPLQINLRTKRGHFNNNYMYSLWQKKGCIKIVAAII